MERIELKNTSEKEQKEKLEYHSESDDSLFLFKRANNPIIKEQFINLMLEARVRVRVPHKTRAEIEEEYDKRLQDIQKDTPITYQKDASPVVDNYREVMPIKWTLRGKTLNEKQMAIAEAHEKGHVLRNFDDIFSFFDFYFRPAVDLSAIKYTEEDFNNYKAEFEKSKSGLILSDHYIYEMGRKRLVRYFGQAVEIAERMSQLKNYFGFTGDEVFTKEHLDYARKNYIKDTGFDNEMTHFFQAITPETEEKFLELINKSGI